MPDSVDRGDERWVGCRDDLSHALQRLAEDLALIRAADGLAGNQHEHPDLGRSQRAALVLTMTDVFVLGQRHPAARTNDIEPFFVGHNCPRMEDVSHGVDDGAVASEFLGHPSLREALVYKELGSGLRRLADRRVRI